MAISHTMILAFLVILVFIVLIPVLVGVFVYRDAKARRMDAALWTVIAVIAPGLIGLIIYLIVRNGHADAFCPKCGAEISEQYLACPRCGAILKRCCTACGAPAESGWQVCPHCAAPLPPEEHPVAKEPRKRERGLLAVILCAVLLPVLLCVLLFLLQLAG